MAPKMPRLEGKRGKRGGGEMFYDINRSDLILPLKREVWLHFCLIQIIFAFPYLDKILIREEKK